MADPRGIDETGTARPPANDAALVELLGAPGVWVDAPPDLVDRICASIAEESTAEPVDHGIEADDRRFRHRVILVGAAVVIAVAAVAGSILGTGGDDRLGGSEIGDFALSGTELAPDAIAVAELFDSPSGLRIVLDVDDLPPAPPDAFYEAWVRNDEGGVSAGTFHLRGGDARIELWAGVTPEDFPRMTITLEPIDGGPESSGQVVLAGSITPSD